MLGTQHLGLFIVSGLVLNMTPGPDTLYIVGRSMAQGRRAGVLSVLGITSGCVLHTCAAAFGLSAILATSARAFLVVKLAGAAYLGYVGLRMLLERPSGSAMVAPLPQPGWVIFRDGFLTNALNPKVALFFLAFLPQFVDPDATSKVATFLFLGAVFMFNGTLWCLGVVASAAALSRRWRARPESGAWLKRVAGAVFIGLGLKLAVSR